MLACLSMQTTWNFNSKTGYVNHTGAYGTMTKDEYCMLAVKCEEDA